MDGTKIRMALSPGSGLHEVFYASDRTPNEIKRVPARYRPLMYESILDARSACVKCGARNHIRRECPLPADFWTFSAISCKYCSTVLLCAEKYVICYG